MRKPKMSLAALLGVRTAVQPPGFFNYLGVPVRTRMSQLVDPATFGPQFFSAAQADQRNYLGAGYDGGRAYNTTARQPASRRVTTTTYDPKTRTATSVRVEGTERGYIDLGGTDPTDFAVAGWR